jgi:hypothetical protein
MNTKKLRLVMMACLVMVLLGGITNSALGWGFGTRMISSPAAADSPAGLFYESLLPYGEWVWLPAYGWCWDPYNVPIDWRPYTVGYWAYTDYGWTWMSDEPWGWACYHYGRWNWDDYRGWVWCPGTEWAPAWVVWRYNDGYVGWAPCPSSLRWQEGRGFAVTGVNLSIAVPGFSFSYVEINHFHDRQLHNYFIPEWRSGRFVHSMKTSVDIGFEHKRIVNHLPVHAQIEKREGHKIESYRAVDSDSIRGSHGPDNKHEIAVFHPDAKGLGKKHDEIVRDTQNTAGGEHRDLDNRHETERKALDERHTSRIQNLEEIHQKEIKQPPANVPVEKLKKQHEDERKALEQTNQRENKLLQNWHQQEKRAVVPVQGRAQKFNIQNNNVKPQQPSEAVQNKDAGHKENNQDKPQGQAPAPNAERKEQGHGNTEATGNNHDNGHNNTNGKGPEERHDKVHD